MLHCAFILGRPGLASRTSTLPVRVRRPIRPEDWQLSIGPSWFHCLHEEEPIVERQIWTRPACPKVTGAEPHSALTGANIVNLVTSFLVASNVQRS